jgi:hypothetical protein
LSAKRLDAHHFRRLHENPSCYFVPVDYNRGFWTSSRRRLRHDNGMVAVPPRDASSTGASEYHPNRIRIGAGERPSKWRPSQRFGDIAPTLRKEKAALISRN